MSASGPTILFLVDEIKTAGLTPAIRHLVERLRQDLDVVLVAQCYLSPRHRARRLPSPCEFYGFPAADFEADVTRFAASLAERRRPTWAVAYGWENPQLVAALDALGLPILLYLDHAARGPHAEIQIYKVFRHVTEIVFGDAAVRDSLTAARWALDAREVRVLEGLRREPEASGWIAAVRRRLVEPSLQNEAAIAQTAVAIATAGTRCTAAKHKALANCARDARLIGASDSFDMDLFLPAGTQAKREAAISDYLRGSQLAAPRDRPCAGRLQRRPLAGFHPLIYASDNPAFDESTGEDPLAHFIRTGRPAGRWAHPVLRPGAESSPANGSTAHVKVAIHGHFHYPNLLPAFLDSLAVNRATPDLFVTTTSEERRGEIARVLEAARLEPKRLIVCPNRGRDIWPFLDLLQQGAFHTYDAVGHVHAKRSPHYAQGALWRDFLLDHLVGGRQRTMDSILAAFAADPRLGLVFAEDPFLTGWEGNLVPATALATRAGMALPLPNHFDYPVGTMFWAQPDALRRLADLRLSRDDVPAEPLPEDGTILHALERLVPFLVEAAGYTYATTHVAGSRR